LPKSKYSTLKLDLGRAATTGKPMSIKTKSLNVHADSPDLRDRFYNPPLRLLGKICNAPAFTDEHGHHGSRITDQGQTSACTGFVLAGLVEALVSKASIAGENLDVKPAPRSVPIFEGHPIITAAAPL
jgi:hypothetical protein